MIVITVEGSYWEIDPTDAPWLVRTDRQWPRLVKARPASPSGAVVEYDWQLVTGKIVAITYLSLSEIEQATRPGRRSNALEERIAQHDREAAIRAEVR